ncbi:TonB-dependent receptor [Rubrivirga sp. S365]|uniref:TonB-dependent receptor n=1 Tax=Rubrivirga litoralis TaxID=3075598 RepID=A0ABU3BLS7_9BACT|nr:MULTISPECIES: TonB-dependent receptor [unclassified Rubrivirga]MDT0630240.1 TonB-dependent receptor [Rubrivirga sp. F394]MDT7855751.1 TonB-dependent receptor [Rubrivirga sp. S365]
MIRRYAAYGALLALAAASAPPVVAQNVSGVVSTVDFGPVPGANVVVDGTFTGRATDADGRFALDVDFSEGARVLRVSYTGYETQRVTVDGPTDGLQVTLQPQVLSGGDVVVSASRQEETILEAPVTIERVGAAALARMPSTEIITSMDRLKGVDVSRSSMLISSISTRGFNSAKAERVIQLVDGVDFLDPVLSLYAGNLTGVPEIDIEGVEIVYGANSALYGANAFNGVVQFQTLSPFLHTGPSAQVRTGGRGMVEFQGRFAQKVSDRFAYKLVGSFFEADDFVATNFSTLTTIADNFEPDGSVRSPLDPRGADVVNRYGEAVALTPATVINAAGTTLGQLGLEGAVFTPGFTESDLVLTDYRARSLRFAATASYLVTDAVKATLALRTGSGNGIYQSSNRYAFDGIGGSTAALTAEGEAWTARAYVIDSEQGDTYDLGFLGSFMNLQPYVRPDGTADPAGRNYATAYAQTYAGAFAQARLTGASVEDAYVAAAAATAGIYPTIGDARFETIRDATLASTTPGQSPRFESDGQIYHTDAQYRFALPGELDAAVGGSVRLTRLRSNGTLYADGPNSPLSDPAAGVRDVRDGIANDEYGGYLQLQRAFLDDALKLSAVGRVDGFRNFDARFSPRVSGVYSFGVERRHNVRASFSQAFRQPAQLDQFIYLDVGRLLLVGNTAAGFETASLNPTEFGQPTGTIDPLRLERMTSFEVGYKGILGGKLFADVSYYRSVYDDFIGTRRFLGRESGGAPDAREFAAPPAPSDAGFANRTRAIQTWLNADQSVTSQGVQLGLEYAFDTALVLAGNYAWADIEEVDDLILGFNTPEHKFNVGASGQITEALGYGANLRWVDDYLFEMPFAEGVIESHVTLDAQASYGLPSFGVTVLAGGTNLTGSQNLTAYGAAVNERILYVGLRYTP